MIGPMLPWAINNIRERLPDILEGAGADEMAERVRKEGFDASVLDAVEEAMIAADADTFRPGTAALEEARNWTVRWKMMHPQFLAGIDIAAF